MSESKEAIAKKYTEVLGKLGFNVILDPEGDVSFRRDGGYYIILIDVNDPKYFRIIYPGFWKIETEQDHQIALEASNEANSKTKLGKVYIIGKTVAATVEARLLDDAHIEDLILASFTPILTAGKVFIEHVSSKSTSTK